VLDNDNTETRNMQAEDPHADTIAAAVTAGVTWLDREVPGWRDRIDPASLRLASPCQCILGQLYRHNPGIEDADYGHVDANGYDYAVLVLHPDILPGKYGFTAPPGVPVRDMQNYFAALDQAWREALAA
jgi:hypothetical protein